MSINRVNMLSSVLKVSSSGVSRNLAAGARAASTFANVPLGPVDPILGLNEAFQKDTSPQKVNLGVGAYRDDQGKPMVLNSVRKAEKIILDQNLNKEYLPIAGLAEFCNLSLKFAFGANSAALKENRIAAIQSLSGTGACRIGSEFISRFNLAAGKVCYQPNPTWGNHVPIFKDAGVDVKTYPYYDKATNTLDLKGWLKVINEAQDGSAFLVHACAHNPTGLDPTEAQWKELSKAFKAKNHLVLMDCAYQGFASGDAEKDAYAIRLFEKEGVSMMLAQSYAKNFGLYGERVGCFSVVCKDVEEKDRVLSQLKIIVRPMYSNPPCNGARIVATVLKDDKLAKEWTQECKQMADRIHSMRSKLVEELKKAGSKKDWSHVTSQIGMFCFTGISPEQVDKMINKHHIYMTKNGRISMAGVTSANAAYVAQALHDVSK